MLAYAGRHQRADMSQGRGGPTTGDGEGVLDAAVHRMMLCAEASGDRELCEAFQEVRSRLSMAPEWACSHQLGSSRQLLQPQVQRLDTMLVDKLQQTARVVHRPGDEDEGLGGRITSSVMLADAAGSLLLPSPLRTLTQPLFSADDEARLSAILSGTAAAESQAETPCKLHLARL